MANRNAEEMTECFLLHWNFWPLATVSYMSVRPCCHSAGIEKYLCDIFIPVHSHIRASVLFDVFLCVDVALLIVFITSNTHCNFILFRSVFLCELVLPFSFAFNIPFPFNLIDISFATFAPAATVFPWILVFYSFVYFIYDLLKSIHECESDTLSLSLPSEDMQQPKSKRRRRRRREKNHFQQTIKCATE